MANKSSQDQTHKVFVYGTLKTNCRNSYMMDGATYIGDAHTFDAKYTLFTVDGDAFDYSYPGINEDGTYKISGEVYNVDEDHLKRLDDFEDEGLEYTRCRIQLDNQDWVWGYIYKELPKGSVKIHSQENLALSENIASWKNDRASDEK